MAMNMFSLTGEQRDHKTCKRKPKFFEEDNTVAAGCSLLVGF